MDKAEERRLLELRVYDTVETPSGSDFDDSDADPDFLDESSDNVNSVSSDSSDSSIVGQTNQPTATVVPAANVQNWNIPNINSIRDLVYNPNQETIEVNPDILETMPDATPYQFFSLFVGDDVINLIVNETNRYAQQLIQNKNLKRKARLKRWTPTDASEIRNFLGILLWMGLVQMLSIACYWKKDGIYQCNIPKYMSRNRFELLLSTFHLSDNLAAPAGDRLYKVQPLIYMMVTNFNNVVIPEEFLCIDESMIPFLGSIYKTNAIAMASKFSNCAQKAFIHYNIKYTRERRQLPIWQFQLK